MGGHRPLDNLRDLKESNLATEEGADQLYAAVKGRKVDALLANAGRGLGHAFLDQDPKEWRRVVAGGARDPIEPKNQS